MPDTDYSKLVGKRVRVTFEARVDRVDSDDEMYFRDGNNIEAALYPQIGGFKVEELGPELVDRGIYRDADGDVFVYRAGPKDFLEPGTELSQPFTYPTRPLVRLVPESD